MKYRAVKEWGEFEQALRNILLHLDGNALTLDLVPSVVSPDPVDVGDETDEALRDLKARSQLIVEGNTCLRLSFETVLAVAVREEFVDLFGDLYQGLPDAAPKLANSLAVWPLLEVMESPWKSTLPDYQGGDDDNLRHFKVLSMECLVDVLGYTPTANWVQHNPRTS